MAKERWITVNGNHILIKEGQSVKDALGDKFAKKKRINKGKYEYTTDGENYEDMDKDSYDELEAEEDSFDENEDNDFQTEEFRKTPEDLEHERQRDEALNELGKINQERHINEIREKFKDIKTEKDVYKLQDEIDLLFNEDLIDSDTYDQLSDELEKKNFDTLKDIDDLNEDDDYDPIENEDFDIGDDDPDFTEGMNKEPEGRWKELTDKKDEFYDFLSKEVGSAGEERNLNKSGDQLFNEWQEALINKYNLSPEEAYAISKRTMGFANAPLEQLAKGYKKPDDEAEPNPMDEFSGPDQEGPSFAQLEAEKGKLKEEDKAAKRSEKINKLQKSLESHSLSISSDRLNNLSNREISFINSQLKNIDRIMKGGGLSGSDPNLIREYNWAFQNIQEIIKDEEDED